MGNLSRGERTNINEYCLKKGITEKIAECLTSGRHKYHRHRKKHAQNTACFSPLSLVWPDLQNSHFVFEVNERGQFNFTAKLFRKLSDANFPRALPATQALSEFSYASISRRLALKNSFVHDFDLTIAPAPFAFLPALTFFYQLIIFTRCMTFNVRWKLII